MKKYNTKKGLYEYSLWFARQWNREHIVKYENMKEWIELL